MEFLKKISIQAKLIFGAIFGIIGTILFLVYSSKDVHADLEEEKKKADEEIKKLEKEANISAGKVIELSKQEEVIRKDIEKLEKQSFTPKDVTNEELDNFFDERLKK